MARLVGHKGPVNEIKVSDDHSFLATASSDATVRLWTLPSAQHHQQATSLTAFSLASSADAGEERVDGKGWATAAAKYEQQKDRYVDV